MKYPNPYFKEKKCQTCKNNYTPTAPSQKYCCVACKGKTAYYQRNYGITESEYEVKKYLQDHTCMICGTEGFIIGKNGHSEKLVVDHDHDTGQVRDLLCHNCNRALGLFQDNVEILSAACSYLEKWKKYDRRKR